MYGLMAKLSVARLNISQILMRLTQSMYCILGPSEDDRMQIIVNEIPPDSVQILWKATLSIPASHR